MSGGPYDAPYLYDILHGPGTAAGVDVLQRIAARHRPAGRRRPWLEPACGTGRYLRVIAGRGGRIVGFDLDPRMVDYARASLRRRGLAERARVRRADLADCSALLPPGGAGFAFCPYGSIRHLNDDRSLQAHLAGMAELLAPGAAYVVGLDLHRPEVEPREDVWTAARGPCRVTQVVNYLPPPTRGPSARIETVLSHLMVDRPRGVTHHDARYRLRTYTEAQWRRQVARSPLRRAAVLDATGRPRADRDLPYQLEILVRE